MEKQIEHEWTSADGKNYCITQDTVEPRCIRLHIQERDSVGQPCWQQAICTHPQSRSRIDMSYDHNAQALHEAFCELLRVVKEGE